MFINTNSIIGLTATDYKLIIAGLCIFLACRIAYKIWSWRVR